jgi:hypothetical protein
MTEQYAEVDFLYFARETLPTSENFVISNCALEHVRRCREEAEGSCLVPEARA